MERVSTGGIGFSGLLTVAFIVLKLTAVIDWSWWWVASPLWIPIGIVLGFIVIGLTGGIISGLWKRYVCGW